MKNQDYKFLQRVPLSVLFFGGGAYVFVTLHLTNWVMFRSFVSPAWIYLILIVVLAPGWLVPLAKCESVWHFLLWMLAVVLVSFGINLAAHYGMGAGDLGPGPV